MYQNLFGGFTPKAYPPSRSSGFFIICIPMKPHILDPALLSPPGASANLPLKDPVHGSPLRADQPFMHRKAVLSGKNYLVRISTVPTAGLS